VIKGWLLIAVLMVGLTGCTHTVRPGYYDHITDPPYPAVLYHSGVSGFVYGRIDARPDGTITGVQLLDSSHPKFSEMVVSTASRCA